MCWRRQWWHCWRGHTELHSQHLRRWLKLQVLKEMSTAGKACSENKELSLDASWGMLQLRVLKDFTVALLDRLHRTAQSASATWMNLLVGASDCHSWCTSPVC